MFPAESAGLRKKDLFAGLYEEEKLAPEKTIPRDT